MSYRIFPHVFNAIDFFAGSGLVTKALSPYFKVAWANDVSEQKAVVYRANHGTKYFHMGDIKDVRGESIPYATLAWASFPCQDLSLAGKTGGIHAPRSGLVWEWLRVIDEMSVSPPLLVAENVQGLISSQGGRHYAALHSALVDRGYRVGALLIDAALFVPQSRPRVFVVAVKESIHIDGLVADTPGWANQPKLFKDFARQLNGWVWWKTEPPCARKKNLIDCVEHDAAFPDQDWQNHNIAMIPASHMKDFLNSREIVAAGYKRIRQRKQVLEIRFDGVAGCLRTPCGGSSKQLLIFKERKGLKIRFMTAREAARLMGAPDSYKLPGSYLDGYRAMGDAVALPAVKHLAKHLLYPLAEVSANHVRGNKRAV